MMSIICLSAKAQVGPSAHVNGGQTQASTWTDPATGLMWTKKEKGDWVDWKEAHEYCHNLKLGGYSNWRLPELNELQHIYDRTQFSDSCDCAFKGGIRARGHVWSNTVGNASGEAFFLDDDKRVSGPRDYRFLHTALCVR